MKLKFVIDRVTFRRGVACALALAAVLAAVPPQALADVGDTHTVLVRDITSIEGVRDNLLVGYGLVVGLHQTGDSQETYFTVQSLTNALQKMGVLISPAQVEVRNVAAVFVTASLPPFARPGEKVDVTVASVGDARSLEGGVLLMSALHGPDGKIYAEAQGPLVFGGYYVGAGFNVREVNHTTTGIIPNGGIVERDTAVDVRDFKTVSLLLHNPDFTTAADMSNAINREFSRPIATVIDSRRVDVNVAASGVVSVPDLIAQLQSVSLMVHTPAKIIVNERTGTIVLGGNVKLSPVSIIHGNLSIQVTTTLIPSVAQNANGTSTTTLVPQTNLNVNDGPAQTLRLDDGANVEELVNGLHALGTTAPDVVAILQSIKAEGGLQADLEVQ